MVFIDVYRLFAENIVLSACARCGATGYIILSDTCLEAKKVFVQHASPAYTAKICSVHQKNPPPFPPHLRLPCVGSGKMIWKY